MDWEAGIAGPGIEILRMPVGEQSRVAVTADNTLVQCGRLECVSKLVGLRTELIFHPKVSDWDSTSLSREHRALSNDILNPRNRVCSAHGRKRVLNYRDGLRIALRSRGGLL